MSIPPSSADEAARLQLQVRGEYSATARIGVDKSGRATVTYAYYASFLRYTLQTIAITNQKGGSGKTTTAVNLAAALGEQGHRVLLLDLDPQASASAWLGCTSADRGLLAVFTDNVHLAHLARRTNVPNVDIIPSSTWLVGVDKAVASEVGSETLLRQAFTQLDDNWEYVVVDCPPTLGFLSVAAFVACQAILVPVETRVMALGGLAALIRTVDRVRERLNANLRFAGIFACRVDLRTNLSRTILARLRERFGDAGAPELRPGERSAGRSAQLRTTDHGVCPGEQWRGRLSSHRRGVPPARTNGSGT